MTIIDHAQRIAEDRAIEEMERYSKPLLIIVAAFLIAIAADGLLGAYANYKHAEQIQAASAFASCLNGQKIEIGDSLASCNIEKITLVAGIEK